MNKGLYFYAALVIVAAGCSKNEICSDTDLVVKQTFSVNIDSREVKTCLGDKVENAYKVLWCAGDAININGVGSKAITEGGATAEFSFTETVSAPYCAVYPASAYAEGRIIFPAEQTYAPSQFDADNAVMLGYSTSENITMGVACGFVQVAVLKAGEETVKSIKLYSLGGEPMSGTYDFDCEAGTLTYAADGSNYVCVSGDMAYDNGKVVAVIAVPAGTYSEGFAINVIAADGTQMTKNAYKGGVDIQKGKMLAMPELTFTANAKYSGGSGTENDPWIIATAEDLVAMSAASRNTKFTGCYKQVCDIDMSAVENFQPIAEGYSSSTYFAGVYDGNNCTISNLKITSSKNGTGLFGSINQSASSVIRNVILDNAVITSTASSGWTGAIIGDCYGGKIEYCHVYNSRIEGTSMTGGIAGRAYVATITGCTVDDKSSVSGTDCVGGIAGGFGSNQKYALTVQDCTAECPVDGNAYIGGIFGGSNSKFGGADACVFTIKDCRSCGEVTGTDMLVGGIIGGFKLLNTGTLNVTDCESCGDVSGTKNLVGGIMGGTYTDTKNAQSVVSFAINITGCTSYGDIAGGGTYYTGGILGGFSGANSPSVSAGTVKIIDCKAHGDVTCSAGQRVAGIMGGTAGMISNSLCLIDKCYASGNIKGASAVAGIAGCPWSHENDGADNSSVITISNCAYCGNTIEANTPASSGYFGAGGMLGWNRVAGTTNIFNCVSRVRNIKFPSLTASKNLPYGVGGIIGYTSVAKGNIGEKTNVAGCYSDIARSGFLIDGEALPEGDKDKNGLDINYGGVFGLFSSDASSGGTTLSTVFHNPEVQVGADNHALKSSDAAAYTTMDELLTALNGYAAVSSNETWVLGADGFPIQAIFKDEVE